MKRYTTGQVIAANIRPLSLIALATVIGFLLGSAWVGLAVGVGIIALVNLFF